MSTKSSIIRSLFGIKDRKKVTQTRITRPDVYHNHIYITETVDTILGMVAKSEGKSKTQKANELLQKALGEEVIKRGMIILQYANAKAKLREENPEIARFAFLFAKYNRQKGRNISMFLPKNPPRQ